MHDITTTITPGAPSRDARASTTTTITIGKTPMITTTTPKPPALHAAGHHPFTARAAARPLTLAAIATIVAASITAIAPGSTGTAPATAAFPAPGASAHRPINVTGNAQLAAVADRGSGTPADPYVIENRVIDAGGSYPGILIKSTSAHLIIQNCTVMNMIAAIPSNTWGKTRVTPVEFPTMGMVF